MKEIKYTDNMVKDECEKNDLEFVEIFIDNSNIKRRRKVRYICNKHRDKGIQEKPVEKLFNTIKPCKYCNHSRLKETFIDEMKEINPNIEVLTQYVNWNTKIKCRCKIDKNEWDTLPSVLLYGGGCPICGRIKANRSEMISDDDIRQRIFSINPDIEVLGEYSGFKKSLRCKCRIDGCEWESRTKNLLNGTAGCPMCRDKRTRERCGLTHETFIKRLSDINENIVALDKYQNAYIELRFLCKKHNYEFKASPRSFLYRCCGGCPLCTQSTGERKLISLLKQDGREISTQHTFKGCSNINLLRFDAFDKKTGVAYEYQGQQHYYPVDFAGKGKEWSQRQFEITQKRDLIKEKYCKENNIHLVKIPYWDYDNMDKYIIK